MTAAAPAGRSFLDALPAVEAKIEAENPPERGLMLTLKSGEERPALDDRPAEVLYGLRLTDAWGRKFVLFADGSLVDPAEVAHARPLVKEDLGVPASTAQATSDAVGAIADAASALADAADGMAGAAGGGGEPVTAGDAPAPWGPEDFANWTPEAVAMRWAELRATPTLESYDEFTALTAEKKRRGLDAPPVAAPAPAPTGAAT